MLLDQSLRLLVLWSQNSIYLVLGLNPRTKNCYLWDQTVSSNPISSPCGELMGLRPMLLPNLTHVKCIRKTYIYFLCILRFVLLSSKLNLSTTPSSIRGCNFILQWEKSNTHKYFFPGSHYVFFIVMTKILKWYSVIQGMETGIRNHQKLRFGFWKFPRWLEGGAIRISSVSDCKNRFC